MLPPAWLLSQEGEVSSFPVAPALDKLTTPKNIRELRALITLTTWRQQIWLVFRLWVLWNVYLYIWYVQNQPSSAKSFRLVWQLRTILLSSTISVPDKEVSYPPGTVLEFLHICCIIAIFERYHSSIKWSTSMYHDQAKMPNVIKRRTKKRKEKNGAKKPRGKISSVLRHQSFQHVKLIV